MAPRGVGRPVAPSGPHDASHDRLRVGPFQPGGLSRGDVPMNDACEDEDRELRCADCDRPFVFTVRDQQFFAAHRFQPPKRCPDCRLARRLVRGDRLRYEP
jgi:hypothetical protein